MKRLSLNEAVSWIQDGDTVAFSGFLLANFSREMVVGIKNSFLNSGHPRDLTIVHAAGCGINNEQGIFELSIEGLMKRYISGHYLNSIQTAELANRNVIEAYNLPQGVITKLYRAKIENMPGHLSKVGLNTFVDPRNEGGKMNEEAKEDLVEVATVGGEEFLNYKTFGIDVGIIRGTSADENGNITMDEEACYSDALEVAMAAKASGGIVIAQVKNIVDSNSICRSSVKVPGIYVDGVILSQDIKEYHRQTGGEVYDPSISGQNKVDLSQRKTKLPLDARKIIARRAAFELKKNAIVNLGIGIPEVIGLVADEENITQNLVLTVESGIIGGVPLGGRHFGASINAWAAIPMISMFDFYNGGGLDAAFLGFAEIDQCGNVNSSKFGDRIAGIGGFIDISQPTKNIFFCGTFTNGGLKIKVEDGKVNILEEGKRKKLKKRVQQLCYNAQYGIKNEQNCLFITERAVLQPTPKGLKLLEVAPGIDIQKDILDQSEFEIIVDDDLRLMDQRIFEVEPMNLRKDLV